MLTRAVSLAFLLTALTSGVARPHTAGSSAGEGAIEYTATVESIAAGARAVVEVVFPPGQTAELFVDEESKPFVSELTLARGRARYRFDLGRAARAIDDPDRAALRAGVLIAPTSTWLLRPPGMRAGAVYRLSVRTPAGLAFVSGLPPAAAAQSYQAELDGSGMAPYAAFGSFDRHSVDSGSGVVEVALARSTPPQDGKAVLAWIRAAARAIVAFYGRFPVRHLLVVVLPESAGIQGKQLGGGGTSILVGVAPGADPAKAPEDWVVTHEMVHVATPDLPRRQLWLIEGLATYVEPVARARAGDLSAASAWADMLRGMPKGRAAIDAVGLDQARSWGATYWGGALFGLLADVEIREMTRNKQSLQDALRAVLEAGGNGERAWPLRRLLEAADRPLPRPVLGPLYDRMGGKPTKMDLDDLWKRLGVALGPDRQVVFDDRAPLAAVRRAITAPAR